MKTWSKEHLVLAEAFDRGELSEAEYLAHVFGEPPITTGEKRAGKRILSVDRVTPSRITSPMPEQIDIRRLMAAVGLDSDERCYLWASAVDRVPRRLMTTHLQWDSRRVERIRVRLGRRLAAFRTEADPTDFVIRGNSRELSYDAVGGHRRWTLAPLSQTFESLMTSERLALLAPQKQKTQSAAA